MKVVTKKSSVVYRYEVSCGVTDHHGYEQFCDCKRAKNFKDALKLFTEVKRKFCTDPGDYVQLDKTYYQVKDGAEEVFEYSDTLKFYKRGAKQEVTNVYPVIVICHLVLSKDF